MHLSSYLKKDPGKPPATVFMTLSTHLLYGTVGGLANPNNNLNSLFLILSSEGFHKKSNSDIMKNFLHSYISEKGVGGWGEYQNHWNICSDTHGVHELYLFSISAVLLWKS